MAIAMAEKHEAVLKLVYQHQQYAQQAHGQMDIIENSRSFCHDEFCK